MAPRLMPRTAKVSPARATRILAKARVETEARAVLALPARVARVARVPRMAKVSPARATRIPAKAKVETEAREETAVILRARMAKEREIGERVTTASSLAKVIRAAKVARVARAVRGIEP